MSYGYQGGPGVPGNQYDYPNTTQQAGYRYPQPPPPEPLEPEYAGFGVRFGARFLDELFRMIAAMVAGFIAGIIHAVLMGPIVPGAHFARTIVVSLVADVFYFAIAEGTGGATLGKMILGLRVQARERWWHRLRRGGRPLLRLPARRAVLRPGRLQRDQQLRPQAALRRSLGAHRRRLHPLAERAGAQRLAGCSGRSAVSSSRPSSWVSTQSSVDVNARG